MKEPGTLEDLRDVGAYLQGHFLLTTGRHSDTFFLLARLTERPKRLRPWVETLQENMKNIDAHTIVGPAMGGIIPSYALASLRDDARVVFAEKSETGTMVFRRGFRLERGERVIIVEDAMTTGSSILKVMDAVLRQGAQVSAVGVLVNRSFDGKVPWQGIPFFSVLDVPEIETWMPEDCPLCQQGVPLSVPKE